MATMADIRRSHNQRHNPNLQCGSSTNKPYTETTHQDIFYSVQIAGKVRTCKSLSEVNAIIAKNPSAKVVKTVRTTTVRSEHKRIR
jgi:hypothetical protein